MKIKSLLWKSVAVLSLLIVVMSVMFTSFSYFSERNLYNEQLLNVQTSLGQQINIEQESIISAVKKMGTMSYETYMKEQEIDWIYWNLQSMIRDGYIANSYLIKPDLVEKDGKIFVSIIQANERMIQAGQKPLMDIEVPEAFRKAYDEWKISGVGLSDVYSDSMGEWMTILSPIKDHEGNAVALFAVDFDYTTIHRDLNNMLWRNIAAGGGTGLVFILIISLLIRRTIRPLNELAQMSLRAANGDLTVRIPVRSQDEIGMMSANFNSMITYIRELIRSMKETTRHVTDASNQLTTISQQTEQSTNGIASSIQEIASGSETQMIRTEESKVAMGEMTGKIFSIAESSANVSEHSFEAARFAEQGNEVVRKNIVQMNSIHTSMNEAVAMVRELARQSNEIDQIVSVIGNIAQQTNLLALNASIEAARAGEHGRGFGVVATEVRSLAEQAQESTKHIGELLQSVAAGTRRVADVMEKTDEEVREGAEVSRVAGETFQKVWNSIKDVSEQIKDVSAAAQEMSASSEEVTAILDQLAEIAKNAAENSQNVAASSEEQLAIVEEIASSAKTMSEKMKELEQEMSKFTV